MSWLNRGRLRHLILLEAPTGVSEKYDGMYVSRPVHSNKGQKNVGRTYKVSMLPNKCLSFNWPPRTEESKLEGPKPA